MCGPGTALGLAEDERAVWPELRERLRQPGRSMALMRAMLGGETEVAAVVSVRPDGVVQPLALLVSEELGQALELEDEGPDVPAGVRRGHLGDYDVEVLMGADREGRPRPIALSMSPWISQHLFLAARRLWTRTPPVQSGGQLQNG